MEASQSGDKRRKILGTDNHPRIVVRVLTRLPDDHGPVWVEIDGDCGLVRNDNVGIAVPVEFVRPVPSVCERNVVETRLMRRFLRRLRRFLRRLRRWAMRVVKRLAAVGRAEPLLETDGPKEDAAMLTVGAIFSLRTWWGKLQDHR